MNNDDPSGTSETLLGRVKHNPTDHEAWSAFEHRYGRKIYGWCRQYQLQHADAEEVSQEVLVQLVQKLRGFTYDSQRSFRGWLRTLTCNAVKDFLAARLRREKLGLGHAYQQLENAEAHEELARQMEGEFDLELLELTMSRVQQRVEPQTWQAFWLLTHEAIKPKEVAARLSMPIARVYEAKSRVQRMLKAEIQLLRGEDVP